MALNDFGINPLFCVSLPGYTWQCGLKYTDIKIQALQDKEMILSFERKIRGGISSVLRDRYVILDENEKIYCIDAKNIYLWAMSQFLPLVETKFGDKC